MKKLKLFIAGAALILGGAIPVSAQIAWTSKTYLITNPSFETDDAIADLKSCGWATDRVAGWTITPTSASNAQIGIGNSSSTLQGIGDNFNPSNGDKFFYTRNNWNANTTFTLSQKISAGNIPAGLYKLTCKAATYSSNAAFGTFTLSLQEGNNAASSHDGIILNVWNTWGVILFKQADDTDLTITMTFKPGYDGSSKHYAVLLDDFQLGFVAASDAYNASESNTIDFSDIINNAGIYNHTTKDKCPRGWTASKHTVGNGNYTEGEKSDTRLEGWNGGNLDIDYNQTITYLPAGSYTVTAAAQERAEVGRTYVYASTEGQEEATGLVNSSTESDITTSALKVTNGTMKIGIRSTANDWVTADNFRISFLGFDVDAVKAEYETAYEAATTAKNNTEYAGVTGVEKTELESAITTYTATGTKNYGWYLTAKKNLEAATSAFTAAKTTYAALEVEIAKAKALGMTDEAIATATPNTMTGLQATQNLKVAEYNYVSDTYKYGVALSDSWTSTGTNTKAATFSNEHWSGETREYKNQDDTNGQGWNANSWKLDFNQDVALPAGSYVFKVAGRKATGENTIMSLVVKNGETVLGTVSDFPESNAARGINKSGATAFDGEDSEFANGGKGYGWEWRYVKFTLSEDATVNVGISAEGKAQNQWISFGDYTLQTDNEANIALITYNVALSNAQTTLANTDYTNVTGSEKTDLEDAIGNDETLDKTSKTAIEAATTALNDAIEAFTAAKDAYDAFVAAKAVEYENDLPYASATKFEAIATAQGAAAATSKDDAEAKTAVILSAYRKYVESNALAEGVTNATQIAIPDFKFAGMTNENIDAANWKIGDNWLLDGQNNGSISFSTEGSLTDGDGNNDYNFIRIQKNDNNAGIHQVINLEPGNYMMTVSARCQKGQGAKFEAYAGGKYKSIPQDDNQNGQFGRGWNDVSVEFVVSKKADITFGVQADWGKNIWWTATRFRLVKLPTPTVVISENEDYTPKELYANVTFNRTTVAGWNGMVLPFDVTSDEIAAIKQIFGISNTDNTDRVMDFSGITYDEAEGVTLNFTKATEIKAGRPFMIKLDNAGTSYSTTVTVPVLGTVENPVILSANALEDVSFTAEGNDNIKYTFKGTYAATTDLTNVNFALINGMKFYYHTAASGLSSSAKAFRAYFENESTEPNAARVSFKFGDEVVTGIDMVESTTANSDAIYNLSGQRVTKAQKGLYIKNGKKVIIK